MSDPAPDPDRDVLDHTDPDDLRRAYENAETMREASERFAVGYIRIRDRLVAEGIHEPDTPLATRIRQTVEADDDAGADTLDHTDPDDLRWAYERAETVRGAGRFFDVSHETVRKRLIAEGIHEPDPSLATRIRMAAKNGEIGGV